MAIDEIFLKAQEQLRNLSTQIADAEELIKAMKEAGEDVSDWEARLTEYKERFARWKSVLEKRGYPVT